MSEFATFYPWCVSGALVVAGFADAARARVQNARGPVHDVLFDKSFESFATGELLVSEAFARFVLESQGEGTFALEPLELLGVSPKKGRFVRLRPARYLPVLDLAASQLSDFDEPGPSGARAIAKVQRVEIDRAALGARTFFVIESWAGHFIVHRTFVEALHARGFTGWMLDPLRGHPPLSGVALRRSKS